MVQQHGAELPHIGEALLSVRAAIDVVAAGGATRITVQAIDGEQILSAARALARAAGVRLEPMWWPDDAGLDLVITGRTHPINDGGSVLLVEDDALLAGIIQRYLGAHGHPVRVVASAEEAGRALTQERPALVLLDINLPGDTGWSVLRTPAMCAADAPPAVVVSAGTVSPRRLRESGAAGYLPKPFPLEALLAMVHRFATAGDGLV